jgi:hypothetical protein
VRRFRLKPNAPHNRGRATWLEQGRIYDGVVLQDERQPPSTVRLFRPRTEEWVEVPLDVVDEVAEDEEDGSSERIP